MPCVHQPPFRPKHYIYWKALHILRPDPRSRSDCLMYIIFFYSIHYSPTALVLPLSSDSFQGHISGPPSHYGSTIFTLVQGDLIIRPGMVFPEMVFDPPSRILLCLICACPDRGRRRTAIEKSSLNTYAMGVFVGLRFECLSQSIAFCLG